MVFDVLAINQKTLARLQIRLGLIALIGLIWFSVQTSSSASVLQLGKRSTAQTNIDKKPEQTKPAHKQTADDMLQDDGWRNLRYTVEQGDTLEAIFKRKKLSVTELYEILEADEPYLLMDVLRPGDQLVFKVDQLNALSALSLIVDPSKTVSYVRGEGGFVYAETLTPTTLIMEVTRGEINGSFFVSAAKVGLSDRAVMTINQLLKNSLNFRRDLRAGDQFQVVMEREAIDDQAIGHDRLLAVRIYSRGKEFGAYLHSDGAYYNAKGDSLIPALLRFPTQKPFRISSPFNPRRLHPVTGRYAPHNGVDFAMSVGTPVLATGNGRVTRVANHRFAGKYIVLDQFGPYSTRYLHLSKILVTKGQQVERGQVIGLSGNSGRSTGPHLHYELHVHGRPVNPMTADIPMLKSIAGKDVDDFRMMVSQMHELMLGESTMVSRYEQPFNKSPPAKKQTETEKDISLSAVGMSASS